MQIPEIKTRLPITKVLAHYNIKTDPSTSSGRANHIKCPFHQDDKPSCKIYLDTNTYHCFGCSATGDQIEFIQKMEKCDKHTAFKRAAELAGEKIQNTGTNTMGIAECQGSVREVENFAEIFTGQKEGLPRSPKALEYLKQRGLLNEGVTPSGVEVGYNSGVNWKKLKQCITFPLKDKQGNIVSLYGRRIFDSTPGYKQSHSLEFGRHYYSENRSGLYPNYPSPETETLIITEAIIDAATLLQIPDVTPSGIEVLAAYGTNGLTKEHKQAISEWCSSGVENKEIIFFFDGDQAGREGVQRNAEELSRLLSGVEVTTVATPEGEDINSLFVNYGKDCLLQLINERKPVSAPESFSSIEQQLTETVANPTTISTPAHLQINTFSNLQIENPNKITYESQTARYIVKGTLCKQLDKMLISLDVQHLETAIKYRTRLDLYEEKQTRKEAREAAEKLDLRADLIETDLSKLCDLLEELRDNDLQQSKEENNTDTLPDLAMQSKCKIFLSKDASTGSESLIERLNELIGKSGIVGEENNRLFLFVIATSHKMPDTLHALIQGSSGSGKTHLLSKIADLMPSERVVKFTRVTENSFYNYDEYFFKGKLICLEDIDGLKEEALFAWRELISNNQLSSSTSQKDENGNIRSAQRIVRGPMASICATTHGHIYEDNMSRLFIIAVDESHAQTTRIMGYQKQKAAGLIVAEHEKEAIEFIQNCVRILKPCKVVNPYANQLHLPPQAHKIRRLNELYLAFVKQVTIINQYQRMKDEQGRLITEIEDLRTAINIMFESIFLKIDELDGSLRQFFEQLKEYILQKENPQNYEFTQREVRQALNLSKSQLQRHINELNGLEYLTISGGYQNKGIKYKISYWDNVSKLREQIREYLINQLNIL